MSAGGVDKYKGVENYSSSMNKMPAVGLAAMN